MNAIGLLEQLRVVQDDCAAGWTHFWLWCAGLAFAALALYAACRVLAAYVDRMKSGGRAAQLAGVAVTLLLMAYAGTKHTWQFSFSNGLTDNGSYCTNNLAVASWTPNNMLLLDGYALKAQYRNLTVTNELGECVDTWHPLEDGVVSQLTKAWTIPDATNCQISCWAQYVAPVVVQTNGVYHLGGISREMGGSQKYVPVSVPVYVTTDGGERETLTPTNAPPTPILRVTIQQE